MEFDSDEEFTWVKVENTVKERMIDSSLIHKLVPRKLRKRTKVLNKKFAKMSNIKSYSQYVSIKTSVLRDCSDNDETEDEVMSDYEYALLYKSEESLKHYMSKSSDRLWQISWEDQYDDTPTPEKHKTLKSGEFSRQEQRQKAKEKDDSNVDVGWRSVSRKLQTSSQTRDLNYSNCGPTTSTASMEEDSNMTDNESLDKSEKDQLDPLDNYIEEGPVRKKQKLVGDIKRNLTSELESVDSTTTTQEYKTEQEEDISDDFNSNWNYPWHESNSFLGQSTPLRNTATAKIPVSPQTMSPSKYMEHQPKDSGIDEDSQEESSREGKSNAKTIANQTQVQNGDLNSSGSQYMSIKKTRKTNDTSEESANINEQKILEFIIDKEEQHSTPVKKGKNHKKNKTPSKEKLKKSCRNKNKATIRKNKVVQDVQEESATILENEKSVSHDEKRILNHAEAESTTNEMDEDVLGTVKRDNVDVEKNESVKVAKEIIEQTEERSTMIKENSNTSDSMLTPENCDALDNTKRHEKHAEEVINKSEEVDKNEENDNPSEIKTNMDEMHKKRLPPKVMRTEVVNQKYKIIAKDEMNEHDEKNEDTEKALKSTTHDSNDSTLCADDKETDRSKLNTDSDSDAVHEESYNFDETLRMKEDHEVDNETESEIDSYPHVQHAQKEENVIVNNDNQKDEEKQEAENNTVRPFPVHIFRTDELFSRQEEDEDSDDNAGGNMSPRAVRRLQQLKRLNLITGSDSSSDDEEHLQKSRLSKPIQIDGPVTRTNCKVEMKDEVKCEYETSQMHKQKNFNTKKDDDDDEMSDALHSTESKQDLKEKTKENTKTSVLSLRRQKKREESPISDDEIQKSRGDVETNLTDNVPETNSLKRVLNSTSQKTVENNLDPIDRQSEDSNEDSNVAAEQNVKSYKRPCTLDNLITQEELSVYEIAPTFTLKDMDEDEEVFMLNIPNTVDLCSLKNQRMVLKSNKLKLGSQKLKIMHTNTDAITCVFHKGKKNASYKTVNIKPVGTIIARHKLSEVTDLQKLEQSTEDDDSAFESLSRKMK